MRILKRHIIILFALALILSACGQKGIKDGVKWPIEDFNVTDHNGEPFGLKDLEGKVWMANFIFANCPDICPPMTYNMGKLQKMAKEEGIENIEFVSFTVDPEKDTPEALKAYGEQFQLDFSNYHFLTGYSQEFIEEFALENFKALVKKDSEDYVIHQSYFYLVDKDGTTRKYYSGLNDVPYEEIIHDMKALQ